MGRTTPFEVSLSVPLGKPRKTIEFTFHPKGEHTSPFDIAEFPPIRKELRKQVRERVSGEEEWDVRLHSDRAGERLTVIIGSVLLNNETGEAEEWNLRITDPSDVDWEHV